ncbi:hypothetical protein ACFE33_00660 [Falsihalocynthiibacter sp. SS001]|uniref:hypothetical protein n=1 Tax=Falsihalocynthiibacter sp. SS001 TaxID=3349698 RepID=UPI0036D35E6B
MFRKLRVDPKKNWWEVRKSSRFFLFKQVASALKGKEIDFFIDHPLEKTFNWKDFDSWLKDHGVRLDGPSQFDGMMHFSGLTDEAKDEVHFRETRACAVFALQMWSRFRGDNRMIGQIDNSKIIPQPIAIDVPIFRWERPGYERVVGAYDERGDWVYGGAELSTPPLTEYLVTKREDRAIYWQRTIYTYDRDRENLTATSAYSDEQYWPLLNLVFQFPRNEKQYSRFYD